MQVFYAPDIEGKDHYVLDRNESKHLIRVLRMRTGTSVRLIDGRGNLYEGMIEDPDQEKCRIAVSGVIHDFEKRDYRLHLAISPLKNPERFEWLVEKAVEIGVDEISPLICRNTERTNVKTGRIRNIIISAMKQSLKAGETLINEPIAFNDFLSQPRQGKLMIAHCNTERTRRKISDVYSRGNDAVILIGPEGDFADDEIGQAAERNFAEIHLGRSRLRTETAGVSACHSIYFLNQ
jgi:16S rRNA (uracil1498-N3)-methyltransferase